MSRLGHALRTTFVLIVGFAAGAYADVIQMQLQSDRPGPVISRYIQGQFTEHLGRGIYEGVWVGPDSPIPNIRGIRTDVVQALRALKVPVVRWPGGCFADEYHWRDGIGPRDQRPVRKNNWWGGTPETNAFGTHEFFDFAEQIGADSYISVNVASSNPTEMREWIEYMTSTGTDDLANERRTNGRDNPFELAFVGIGNESWGCGGNMTPEYYADQLRRFNAFFHKNGLNFHQHNDNRAVRVGSGANNLDTHWTDVVLGKAAHAMDAISLHYYTLANGDWLQRDSLKATDFDVADWNAILYQASRIDGVIQAHREVMDQHDPDGRIGLYVDEWGTWYRPREGTEPSHLNQQNTLRDALVVAVSLNAFHRHAERVQMANIAQAVNVLQAMVLTDDAHMALTPSYHAMQLYTVFQDARRLPLLFESPSLSSGNERFDAITASAALGDDGRIHLAVANLDPLWAQEIAIDFGPAAWAPLRAQVLTHADMGAHNSPGEAPMIEPQDYRQFSIDQATLHMELPAKSLVVMSLVTGSTTTPIAEANGR